MSGRSPQWVIVILIAVFCGLTLGLSLVLPFPLAAAGAFTATGLSWPFARWIGSRRSPSFPSSSMDRPSTAEDLHRLSPSAFEDIVARAFRSLGFSVDEMDYRGDTYLADFILQHERRGEIAVAVARQVPPDDDVQESSLSDLKRAVERFHASRGILVTTGQIPETIKRLADADDAPIDLIDGALLGKMVS